MGDETRATTSVLLPVPPRRAWEAITTPSIIKQYFFGVDVVTDWKVGSQLLFRGSYNGKTFEDKALILKVEPEKTLAWNYWSSFSGLPDAPENYQEVVYTLAPEGAGTRLTVTQECGSDPEQKAHCVSNWNMVFAGLKKWCENPS